MLGISIDIDGTLVDMNGKLYPETAEVLARHWSSACIILASARPPRGIQYVLEQLGRDGPYIALNGGLISPGSGQPILTSDPIPEEVTNAVYDFVFSGSGTSALFAYDKERWYAWGQSDSIEQEIALTSATPVIVQDRSRLAYKDVIKLLVVCRDQSSWAIIKELLGEQLGCGCTVSQSRPYYVEITAGGVTKGAALETCRKLFGLELCIAIGDGLNDLDMFLSADYSYAVPAAPLALKRQSTHVLSPPHDDSLAQLLYRLLVPENAKGEQREK